MVKLNSIIHDPQFISFILIIIQFIFKHFDMFENSWSIKLEEVAQQMTVASLPKPSFIYQGKSNQLCVYTNNETHKLPIRK